MGITCPDKRLSSWKKLVAIQGDNMSYFLWNEFMGNVPQEYYNKASDNIQYQKQSVSNEGIIASEKTIRDLAARMADRIGLKVIFESDRGKDYKGKLDGNTAVINLANATLDTPLHEILGHPIIRVIKNRKLNSENSRSELYENLLEELSINPKGKEVLDRIKRDYLYKDKQASSGEQEALNKEYGFDDFNVGQVENNTKKEFFGKTYIYKIDNKRGAWYEQISYTLEEQQEEAIVELLGLMTAEKLDAVKDGKLISLLKRLLKEVKAFVKSLLRQREVEIDKLPDNMTLGDLSDLLAYSNSKLILPGYEVEYTTPDNMKFKTYSEASNHISQLAKSVGEVDLDNIKSANNSYSVFSNGKLVYDNYTKEEAELKAREFNNKYFNKNDIAQSYNDDGLAYITKSPYNYINDFIEKNKEYEQAKEIIEEWKKVNNIQYNPEEIYSRGQEFSSVVGAYSSFDVNLMMQNLLAHIEDNQKAGGKFAISAYTKPIDRNIGHLEGGGGKIKFKIYPQSNDILWAANTDVYSGSVWDASEKVNKDKQSELLGVSYTKYPSLNSINTVQPNLASIVDDLSHHHNELGITLTDNNFRLEYDEDIPYQTKKIIDGINAILNQKYGKLVKPDLSKKILKSEKVYEVRWKNGNLLARVTDYNKAQEYLKGTFTDSEGNKIPASEAIDIVEGQPIEQIGIQPTQTKENTTSIESVKDKLIINDNYDLDLKRYEDAQNGIINEYYSAYTDLNGKLQSKIHVMALNLPTVKNKVGMWQSDENYSIVKDYIVGEAENIHGVKFWILSEEFKKEALESYKKPKEPPVEKEYTNQAVINTKIAKLKEVAKKYPRSLIRSEVKPVNNQFSNNIGFEEGELPFQKVSKISKIINPRGFINIKALPLDNAKNVYSHYNLLAEDGNIKEIPMSNNAEVKAAYKWVDTLNLSPNFKFKLTNKTLNEKWRIYIVDEGVRTKQAINKFNGLVDDRISGDTTGDIEKYGEEMFRLQSNNEPILEELDKKLIDILKKNYGLTLDQVDSLKEELGIDALGFTELLIGDARIGIRKFRDRMTLPEEASHVFVAMLKGTPLYDRFYNWMSKNDYYKQVIGSELERYEDLYKNDQEKLIVEAMGKYLAQTFITQELEPKQEIRSLLQRIWDYIKTLIHKFPVASIEKELNILTGEIVRTVGTKEFVGKKENIQPFKVDKSSKLYRITDSLENQRQITQKTLESVLKRLQVWKSKTGYEEEIEKYSKLENELLDKISEFKYLEGIGAYLKSLTEESKQFEEDIDLSVDIFKMWGERFDAKKIKKASISLRNMKFIIDANLHTLENIVENLTEDARYNKELKESYEGLIKESEALFIQFTKAEKAYFDLSGILVSEFLKPLLGDRNSQDLLDTINLNRSDKDKLKFLKLEEALKTSEGDINLVTRWLDALAETPDDILKLLDIAVKNQKTEANQKSLDDRKYLLDLEAALSGAGIKNTDWMAETVNGKITGNIVTEYDWGSYDETANKFFSELDQDIRGRFEVKNYEEFINKSKELSEKYGKAYDVSRFDYKKQRKNFYIKNRLSQTEIEEVLKGKDKQWIYFNTKVDGSGRIYIPRKKSDAFEQIQANLPQKTYYDAVIKLKYELDQSIPEKMQQPRRLPQIRKDWVERVKYAAKNSNKESFVNLFTQIKDVFKTPEDADDRGIKFGLSNDTSKPVKFLPIYYLKKLSKMSELSTDITSTMTMYSAMLRDYAAMSEIIDVMELAKDVVGNREVYRTDSRGNLIMESIKGTKGKFLRNITKPKGSSLVADRLEDFYNMVMYGEFKKDEGAFGNILDAFNQYVSINGLGFNLFAGTANVIVGKTMIRVDAIANEYFGEGDLLWADKMYLQELPLILDGIGALDNKGKFTGKHSKINLWGERNDVFQDYRTNAKELNAGRKNFFSRMFNLSTIFFVNHAGEHYLQLRTSLALSHNYRYDKEANKFVWKDDFYHEIHKLDLQRRQEIKGLEKPTKEQIEQINSKYKALSDKAKETLDKSWKEMTNYYDAHETKGNRLVLKEGFKDNIKDRQAFINKTNALNKSFHGIYNDIDKAAAQQYALFRLVWQFRKWMLPYWNRRYGKGQFNYEKNEYNEGYYRTVFRFIGNLIKEARTGEYSIRKNWATLSPQEKANFRRSIAEVAHLLGYIALAAILTGLAKGGDDDDWFLQMSAYQANRAITEIGAMSPYLPVSLQEFFRTIDQPMAGTNQLKNLTNLFSPWEWGEEIERGRYKGYTKFERTLIKATPIAGQLKDLTSPEEKMVFFNQ